MLSSESAHGCGNMPASISPPPTILALRAMSFICAWYMSDSSIPADADIAFIHFSNWLHLVRPTILVLSW